MIGSHSSDRINGGQPDKVSYPLLGIAGAPQFAFKMITFSSVIFPMIAPHAFVCTVCTLTYSVFLALASRVGLDFRRLS